MLSQLLPIDSRAVVTNGVQAASSLVCAVETVIGAAAINTNVRMSISQRIAISRMANGNNPILLHARNRGIKRQVSAQKPYATIRLFEE